MKEANTLSKCCLHLTKCLRTLRARLSCRASKNFSATPWPRAARAKGPGQGKCAPMLWSPFSFAREARAAEGRRRRALRARRKKGTITWAQANVVRPLTGNAVPMLRSPYFARRRRALRARRKKGTITWAQATRAARPRFFNR